MDVAGNVEKGEEEAGFRRQRTQICRNPAFPGSVTRRTAREDLSSTLLWGIILVLCNKLLQDRCMKVLIMKASCSMLQLIKRSKSSSLPVSWEVGSRAHFIPEKQKWHTAPVPALPMATQETREGFSKNKQPHFYQQHVGKLMFLLSVFKAKEGLDCVLFEPTEIFASWNWQTLFIRLDQVGGGVILIEITFAKLSWDHLVSWSFPSIMLIKIINLIVIHDIFLW